MAKEDPGGGACPPFPFYKKNLVDYMVICTKYVSYYNMEWYFFSIVVALHIVSEVADHANSSMRQGVGFIIDILTQ